MRRQRQPEMIGFGVGLDLEPGEGLCRHLLAPRRVDPLQPRKLGGGAVAHQPLPRREGVAGGGPSAGADGGHQALAQPRRRHDEAERKAGRDFLRQAVEHDATIGRQRRQRRLFVVEKSIDGIFDHGEVELLDHAQQIGAARRRHGDAERILDRGLQIQRRQMRLAMGLLQRIRPHAVLVHRKRHQRHAEPRGNALDEGIGQRLDTAASAGRHHCGKRRGDALPAIGGEDDLLGVRMPVLAGEVGRGNASRRLVSPCWSRAATPPRALPDAPAPPGFSRSSRIACGNSG